jgi:hypothetical protein
MRTPVPSSFLVAPVVKNARREQYRAGGCPRKISDREVAQLPKGPG